jgi:hypothetical protein
MAVVRQQRHVQLSAWLTGAALVWLYLGVAVPASQTGDAVPGLVVNSGRYGQYYHLRLVLTAAAIDFSASDKTIGDGGQFTVRVRQNQFPISAPHCQGSVILRMPWTDPASPGAATKIAAKRSLLERIQMLEKDPRASVPVVLELNPYVEVASRTPLRLQLTYCNAFFRQAFGAYIDHTMPVEQQ